MNRAVVGIGSNINPDENIRQVLRILQLECHLLRVSKLIRTKPIGVENQPDFINAAVLLETNLEQDSFNLYLKKLEDRLGRDRSLPKFGPRTMDLDIVVWNGNLVDDDYYSRDFLQTTIASLGYRFQPDS
ncbi:MAG: 2-amino-4-hydroxy-6-hydroxymethyldihydropteridine diphosphokinase [Mangrovibacterium sp.]